MNKVYKVIYSKVKQCNVVVSEIAKSHGRHTKSSVAKKKAALAAAKLTLPGLIAVETMPTAEAGLLDKTWGGSDLQASGSEAIAAGGNSNHANGDHSSIVGGYSNRASAKDSVVIGGYQNTAAVGGNSNPDVYQGRCIQCRRKPEDLYHR